MKTPWRKLYVLSVAGGLSWLGSSLTAFAVILRDKDHVGATGIASYLLAYGVPSIFMAPIAGVVADKFTSRQVIVPTLVLMGLSSASLTFGFPVWWTLVSLLITASAGTMVGPAMQAVQVTYTNSDDVPRVSGLMQSTAALGQLLAPAIGGILVSTTGYIWPFLIDALSFWILAAIFVAIGLNRKPVEHETGEKFSAMAGLKFVFGDRLIRALLILIAVLVVALSSFNVGEVFLVKDELHASDFVYGMVGAAFAAGSILGSVITSATKLNRKYHATAVIVGIGVLVSAIFGFSVSDHWSVAMGFALITGLGNASLNAYGMGIMMVRSPKEMLGRVNAAAGAIIQTGATIGVIISGVAISIWHVRPVILVSAIISALVLAVFGPDVIRYGRSFKDETTEAEELTQNAV